MNNHKLKLNNTIYNSIKNMKYLGIRLIKYVEGLITGNYSFNDNIFLREIKEDSNKWKDRYPMFMGQETQYC